MKTTKYNILRTAMDISFTVFLLVLSTAWSAATGIVIFDNDVYVSGWESNGTYSVAKYWKNGVPATLGNAVLNSSGNAIIVR
jgi:hypothetical protein